MSAAVPPGEDAAWVVLETLFPPSELAAFCRDIERLYRINPWLEFRSWKELGPDRYRVDLLNLSNGQRFEFELSVEQGPDALRVNYSSGIKRQTRFEIRASATGSSLTITDDYTARGAEQTAPLSPAQLSEVDRSLHAWGVALHRHLKWERRFGGWALWRAWMRRVWLPMKPGARRISWWLLVITAAEFALFLFVVAIYWLEQD